MNFNTLGLLTSIQYPTLKPILFLMSIKLYYHYIPIRIPGSAVVHIFQKNFRTNICGHVTRVSLVLFSTGCARMLEAVLIPFCALKLSKSDSRPALDLCFFRNRPFCAPGHRCHHGLHQPRQGVLHRRAGHRCEELL